MRQDQAERLRLLVKGLKQQMSIKTCGTSKKCRVVVVTSGKGGVGKSNLALGLSLALSKNGCKVMLLDADMGLANIDVILGFVPEYNLSHVLNNRKRLAEILQNGPAGLQIISGASGMEELANLDDVSLNRIFKETISLTKDLDFLFVDTGAGISNQVMAFALAADEVIVVTTPEPTALTDAYGVIKVLNYHQGQGQLKLVVNMARSREEGQKTADKLLTVTREFLGREVKLLGIVPCDINVQKAVCKHSPYIIAYPSSPASLSTMRIALNLGDLPDKPPRGIQGFLEGFFSFFRGSVS